MNNNNTNNMNNNNMNNSNMNNMNNMNNTNEQHEHEQHQHKQHQHNQQKKIRLLSLNIDTNLDLLEAGLFRPHFEQFRCEHRVPHIIAIIKALDVDIVNLQEGRKIHSPDQHLNLDSISPFVESFSSEYHVYVDKYNPTSKSFSYISLIRKRERFRIEEHGTYYLNDTPDQSRTLEQIEEYKVTPKEDMKNVVAKWRKINHGEEFERVIAYSIVIDTESGNRFAVINIHIGITYEGRFYETKKINDLIEKLRIEKHIDKIIASGDFNSFPQYDGKEQMALIDLNVLHIPGYLPDFRVSTDFSTMVAFTDMIYTFYTYLYDFGIITPETKPMIEKLHTMANITDSHEFCSKTIEIFTRCYHKKLLGGSYPLSDQLDHILFVNLDVTAVVVPIWKDGVEACEFTPESIHDAAIREYDRTKGPLLCSDHQALLAEFSLF